jgi:ParB-like chromosome segregation protein Spo0J
MLSKPEKYQFLPDLPPDEYAVLKADIAANGVLIPVEVDEFGMILDGHHRARACRELGINDYPTIVRLGLSEEEKRAHARKLNLLRRHLNREQTRALIEQQLAETPAWSNNRISQMLGVSDKTIAAVRTGLESTSEIPKLEELVGADGKKHPRRQQKRERRVHSGDFVEEFRQAFGGRAATADDLPDDMKLAMFNAGIALDTITLVDGPARRDPFEELPWLLFTLFRSHDKAAGRAGYEPKNAVLHVEWVAARFETPDEWMGDEGDKWRKVWLMPQMPAALKQAWANFFAERRCAKVADVRAELENLQRAFTADNGVSGRKGTE